jgi:hypothetical protein
MMAMSMAEVVEHLPSKLEASSSSPSATKKRERKEGRKERKRKRKIKNKRNIQCFGGLSNFHILC